MARSRVDHELAAHAVADQAGLRRRSRRISLGEGQQGVRVLHDHVDGQAVHQLEHLLSAAMFGIGIDRPQLHFPGSVIEIGQHDVIAGRGEPPGHVAQFLPDGRASI